MNNSLISKLDTLIDNSKNELSDLIIQLVNIRSDLQPATPGAPFGIGVKKVLEKITDIGKDNGFYTTDYNTGVVSISYYDSAPDLGIWTHGDVVPAGEGWNFEPYNAVVYQDRVIGRGAADNKGQIAAVFLLLKFFKKLGIELKYNPALYVGSNEEKGMFDLLGINGNDDAKGFLNVCTPPKLSLVPDGAFPVGYGGKGNVTIKIKTKQPLTNINIVAGQDDAPGKATAYFADGSAQPIETFSPPVHTAHPDPNGNMINKLANILLESDLLSEKDKKVFEFIEKISIDTTGKTFGIDVETDTMKPLSLAAYRIDDKNGCPEIYINIRYPVEITLEKIESNISALAEKFGFVISDVNSIHRPYLLDKNSSIVSTLNLIANKVMGTDKPPYTLGGGTYAHELPNAYVFGSSSNFPPEDWEKGRGGAHGIDETVSLDRLQRAMKIYARALLELNNIDW